MQYDENAEKYGYEGEMTPLKCDKLTAYKGDVTIPVYGTIADAEVYLKKNADAAIAELKAENKLLKEHIANGDVSRITWIDEVIELKQKLHDAEMRADLAECAETERKIDYDNLKKDLAYHARRIYFKHNRQTLRALWLARALRAEARKNYWYARSIHEGDERLWSIDGSEVKYIGCIKRNNFDWLKIWCEVEIKCRAKAEEYK